MPENETRPEVSVERDATNTRKSVGRDERFARPPKGCQVRHEVSKWHQSLFTMISCPGLYGVERSSWNNFPFGSFARVLFFPSTKTQIVVEQNKFGAWENKFVLTCLEDWTHLHCQDLGSANQQQRRRLCKCLSSRTGQRIVRSPRQGRLRWPNRGKRWGSVWRALPDPRPSTRRGFGCTRGWPWTQRQKLTRGRRVTSLPSGVHAPRSQPTNWLCEVYAQPVPPHPQLPLIPPSSSRPFANTFCYRVKWVFFRGVTFYSGLLIFRDLRWGPAGYSIRIRITLTWASFEEQKTRFYFYVNTEKGISRALKSEISVYLDNFIHFHVQTFSSYSSQRNFITRHSFEFQNLCLLMCTRIKAKLANV